MDDDYSAWIGLDVWWYSPVTDRRYTGTVIEVLKIGPGNLRARVRSDHGTVYRIPLSLLRR